MGPPDTWMFPVCPVDIIFKHSDCKYMSQVTIFFVFYDVTHVGAIKVGKGDVVQSEIINNWLIL